MGTNRNEYLYNVARTVIGQIGGVPYDYFANGISSANDADYPEVLWKWKGDKVVEVVKKMGPAARGRIVACGASSSTNGRLAYCEVEKDCVDIYVPGDELLTLLASYVVTAAIVDIIRADVQHIWGQEQHEDDSLSRTYLQDMGIVR